MILLITGASHTGKTLLAQKILEKYQYPYLSIDHLKMGLIHSGNTRLTPTRSSAAWRTTSPQTSRSPRTENSRHWPKNAA